MAFEHGPGDVAVMPVSRPYKSLTQRPGAHHDLARRQAGKFLAVGNRQNLLSLNNTEFVTRCRPCTRRATIGSNSVIAVTHPALEGADRQIQFVTGLVQAATRFGSFSNQ